MWVDSGYRVIGKAAEDQVELYYVVPVGDTDVPEDLSTIFTPARRTDLLDERHAAGPETIYLGRIKGPRPGCSGLVSLSLGAAAEQVLLDVDGAAVAPWIVAVNVGDDPLP